MTELWALSVQEMAQQLHAGETSAEELFLSCLARIDATNDEINAFVHIARPSALQAARQSDVRRARGECRGPLDGIPVGVKDNIFVRGMPASWGSRVFRDFVPDRDDIVTERLRAAGAVLVGKTNTPEFAMSFETSNDLFGITRNPFDPTLTPGGSSGGSSAAVAARMVPLAIATDAGGSTRLPAALTGTYGLRPSNGSVARRFGFPALVQDFQVIGLITATLTDMKLSHSALAGPDWRDPASVLTSNRTSLEGRPIRVGWFSSVGEISADIPTMESVAQAAARLSEEGATVSAISAPYDGELTQQVWKVLAAVGVSTVAHSPDFTSMGLLTRPVQSLVRTGLGFSTSDLWNAMADLARLRQDTSETWGDIDVMLLPSTPSPAWKAENLAPDAADDSSGAHSPGAFTTWVNAMGYPAISVPGAPHPDGRPIGVQLVARPGHENLLFELARYLEA